MRGGQNDARPENHAGTETRLVGATRQHHDDVTGETGVFVGRADHRRGRSGPAEVRRRQPSQRAGDRENAFFARRHVPG
jgi:hypothetical protein